MKPPRFMSLMALTLLTLPCQAVIVDLTTGVNATGAINGTLFRVDNTHPAGTGIFGRDAGGVFLRIQNDPTEEGYNTDTNNVMDNKNGVWTHDVLFSDLKQVTIGGALYVPFLLDVNESANTPLLTLENLQIFSSTTGGLSHGTLALLAADSATTLLYDMDGPTDGDSSVLIDYNQIGGGSGHADMAMFVPVTNFAGVNAGDNIIFYSQFSGTDAGFEEWTLGAGADPGDDPEAPGIPEPSTSLLGLVGCMMILRRRTRG